MFSLHFDFLFCRSGLGWRVLIDEGGSWTDVCVAYFVARRLIICAKMAVYCVLSA